LKRAGKVGVAAGLGLAVLLVVVVASLFAWWPRRTPVVPANVPLAWAEFRTGQGHVTHVDDAHIECSGCHDLAHDGFKDPGPAGCKTCHAKEVLRGHGGKAGDTESCLTCHSFSPVKRAATCVDCHSTSQGATPRVEHHASVACATCHTPHEPTLAGNCTTCHVERAPEHAAHVGSQACADCHQPHAPAAAALASCAGCHEEARRPRAPGHATCEGCHKPHEFVATARATCVGCHGDKPTLASTEPKHAECTTCHAPHDGNMRASAAASCKGCHADITVKHGTKDACVTCHEAHPAATTTAIVSGCTKCHGDLAASNGAAHAGGGTACASCHRPHDFAPPAKAALCPTCHTTEIKLANTNPGHRDCATCHGDNVHRERAAPACGTCHAAEQSTAPPGHLACVGCHEPHSGERRATATCASCHAHEEGGKHAQVTGGCATCHRAHGPGGVATPPTCVSCHERAKLPALHTVDAHSSCTTCHSSHGPTHVDRATCTTSCHVDRRNHQPDAPVCNGCHRFRR
jgi:hypothetical protein